MDGSECVGDGAEHSDARQGMTQYHSALPAVAESEKPVWASFSLTRGVKLKHTMGPKCQS